MKLIRSDPELLKFASERLAELFNQLINSSEDIPIELTTSRLVCLNKNAEEKGKIDAIRPIAVNALLFKILEQAIRTRLTDYLTRNNTIDKRQIGFRKGLGTDVNILRLRQRVDDMKAGGKDEQMFVLFMDFKQAYDQ